MAKEPKSTTEFDVELGKRIRALRLQKNISQMELGEHVGVTFQQVQKYELGRNRVSVSRLEQIAKALGAPLSAFTGPSTVSNEFLKSLDYLSKPGVVPIAQAVAKINDQPARAAVLAIARALAGR